MSTVNGLPAHVLLVHFLVALAPLTAALLILCAVWPAARRRLVWLVAGLAAATLVLTPLTTEAGEWLEHRVERSALISAHAQLGDTMLYVSAALLVAALVLVVVHVRETRGRPLNQMLTAAIAVAVILAAIATVAQVYRIGDSGAKSAWGDALSAQ